MIETSKILPEEGGLDDSSGLIKTSFNQKRGEITQRSSYLFRRNAEEHYFGSIISTNKMSVLGSSIIVRNKSRKDLTNFADNNNETILRRTFKA